MLRAGDGRLSSFPSSVSRTLIYCLEGRQINFGKREYKSNGLLLSQGSGFRNLTVSATDDTPPITRLFCYGGDKNLTADYGSYLMLPNKALYIEKNIEKYGIIEYIKQFENIYPKGEFHVSKKIDNLNFIATDIDFDIAKQTVGVDVVITFQTGALAGYALAKKMVAKSIDSIISTIDRNRRIVSCEVVVIRLFIIIPS